MLDNLFGIAINSGIEIAFRYGALVIAATLFSLLVIRLAMSLATNTGVKARKQWDVEPSPRAHQTLMARLLNYDEKEVVPQRRLNDDMKRLLEQRQRRANGRF